VIINHYHGFLLYSEVFVCQFVSFLIWHTFRIIRDASLFGLLLFLQSLIYIKFLVMNIKPLADRVLIKPAAAEEKTVAGIIIPDSAKEKPLKGEVVAVGNGTKDEEMVLKKGNQVLYGKYAGTEIELDGEKYLIMRQSDILAII